MSIPTARTPSFTGRAASAATTRKARSEMRKTPLKSAQRRTPVDGMDKPPACPPGPQENKTRRSGQLMGHPHPPTSFATDTNFPFFVSLALCGLVALFAGTGRQEDYRLALWAGS